MPDSHPFKQHWGKKAPTNQKYLAATVQDSVYTIPNLDKVNKGGEEQSLALKIPIS